MSAANNPYRGLPDHHFWRRAVSRVERHLLDPVVTPKFNIQSGQGVATAGSCFAQHISRKLKAIGFNYMVTERCQDGIDPQQASARNYGVFSARYGNIYTVRQLLQLFRRAHGNFEPAEDVWVRADGRYADPFRPNIEPDGFASIDALHADRVEHLRKVREMFTSADVFVFTMGLTEGWRSRADGAVFPIAPGVTAGEYDDNRHEFVNFGVEETTRDMAEFLDLLRAVNDQVKVLLTVSPVPLMATFEDRHVLTATTYSKAVLRVAAEQVVRAHDWVDYFPSYEIITGSFNAGVYYQADAREVSEPGVAHAMRCFLSNYAGTPQASEAMQETDAGDGDIVCDEEALDQLRN